MIAGLEDVSAGAVALGLLERRQHARVVGAGVLAGDDEQVGLVVEASRLMTGREAAAPNALAVAVTASAQAGSSLQARIAPSAGVAAG